MPAELTTNSAEEVINLLNRKEELEKSHKEKVLGLKRAIQNVARASEFACVYCKKASPLSLWSFVQSRWYTPPSGCTDGAYWNDTEPKCCHIMCPHCTKQNYLYVHPQLEEILLYMETAKISAEKIFSKVFSSYKEVGFPEGLKQTYPRA
ncbi:hypothetical protein BH11PAT3_BH11PAT3_2380 [soil metagenome]